MRVLVLATPSPTHFAAMVPTVWALRAAGNPVLVAGQPDIIGTARGAGLSTVTVGGVFDVVEMIGWSLAPDQRPIEAGLHKIGGGNWGLASRTWVTHSRYTLDAYLDIAREWRPDLILADPLEFSALIIGGLLGIPVVQHRWGVDPLGPPGLEYATRVLHERCVRLGLPDGLPRPALVIDPCPPSMRLPETPAGIPVRAVPYNGGGTVPAWLPGRDTARPLVVVSLGRMTAALGGVPLIRYLVEALGGLPDVDGIVTVDTGYHAAIGAPPSNVELLAGVPIGALAPTTAALVHHGGAGTGLTAIAHGLPQLVLPGMMDAFPYSDRVTATGIGLGITEAAEQNDPACLRAAIRRLVEEPWFRTAAEALRHESEQQPAPTDLVPRLEALAAVPVG
jgi:glycosyltransferase